MSSKSWVFTLNNYDGHRDRQYFEDTFAQFCTYICFQRELAPTTGTPHLQGWVYLLAPRTMRGLKSTLFAPQRMQGVHLERARGTRDECYTYCSKEESRDPSPGFAFQEFGRFDDVPEGRGQGARNDLTAVARAIQNGSSLREVMSEFPVEYIKFSSGITKMFYLAHAVPRPRGPDNSFTMPYVEWIYGPTGTGKTRFVYDEHDDDKIF
ncbi:replication protein, partial [uncultured marine virus]